MTKSIRWTSKRPAPPVSDTLATFTGCYNE